MAVEKYQAAQDRGTVLTAELDSLANGNWCAVGPEYANQTNKDIWAFAELTVDFATGPTAGSVCQLYAVIAPNGTNYEQGDLSSGNIPPPESALLATFQMDDTTNAQRAVSNAFRLRGPFKHKFLLRNRTGQTFPASGSEVKLHTFNREIA